MLETAAARRPFLLGALAALAVLGQPSSIRAQDESGFTLPTTNPAARVRQAISGTWVEVRYHRPRVKGREIFGGLVPWGQVWRTGADNATQISFGTPVTLGDVAVAAGEYELFTIPEGGDRWTVILQPLRQQWGSYSYDPSHDVARVEAPVQVLREPTESFTIAVSEVVPGVGELRIEWDRLRVSVPIRVDVRETAVPRLEAMLAEAERPPYLPGRDVLL